MKLFKILALLAIGMVATNAKADITYFDADFGNTTLADGTALVEGTHFENDSTAADDRWNIRDFGNGESIFGSNDSGTGEDTPRLKTTISGLVALENYNVTVYFWGAENSQWRARTSLTDDSGDLPGYNTFHTATSSFSAASFVTANASGSLLNPGPLSTSDGAGFENGGYFANQVLTEEGNRSLYEVNLGQTAADSNGNIWVFVDDLANTTNVNRTWYDGVGIEIVPEPTTSGVLLLGLMGFALRRRH